MTAKRTRHGPRVYIEDMRVRLCCLALAIGLVPAAAFAQDGLHSASLPDRRLTRSSTPRPDIFLAGPDTFRPDPTRIFTPVFGSFGVPLYPVVQPIIVVQISRELLESGRVAPAPMLPAPVIPPAPYVAGVPGRPKTFFIIPGCYAGDRRPEPELLKPGCDISRLRVVPPRP